MSAGYEAVIAQAFVDFLHAGYVYKGLKPVHWCIRDRTALAEAEVEYENHSSPSIYVRFRLASDPAKIDPALADRDVYALIWTTTPWTIPANLAICFHPKFEYVAVDTPQGVAIVAEGLLPENARLRSTRRNFELDIALSQCSYDIRIHGIFIEVGVELAHAPESTLLVQALRQRGFPFPDLHLSLVGLHDSMRAPRGLAREKDGRTFG